jgi:hypothetical protein
MCGLKCWYENNDAEIMIRITTTLSSDVGQLPFENSAMEPQDWATKRRHSGDQLMPCGLQG